MSERRLSDMQAVDQLAERLAALPEVGRYGAGPDGEAGTLALMFSELEDSFRVYRDELLPRLLDESLSRDDLLDVLFELGEEFADIVSHLCDSRFFELYVERGRVAGREE